MMFIWPVGYTAETRGSPAARWVDRLYSGSAVNVVVSSVLLMIEAVKSIFAKEQDAVTAFTTTEAVETTMTILSTVDTE